MMKLPVRVLFVLLLFSCTRPADKAEIVITNINIVDPAGRQIIPNQTIQIKDGLITGIFSEEVRLPAALPDSLIIDGTGKYILSGFWNMHSHVTWKADLNESVFPLLLSYGITGVRDMGGDAQILNRFKAQTKTKPATGPVLYGPGPLLDGSNPIHPGFSEAVTEQNVIQVLDSLRGNVDFYKVYSLLPAEVVKQVSAYSRQHDIPIAGHISEYITPTQAAELQYKSIEHLNRIEDIQADSSALHEFIAAAKEANSWFCPTLIIYKRKLQLAEGRNLSHPLYSKVDDDLKAEWQQSRKRLEQTGSDPEQRNALITDFEQQKKLVKWLYQKDLPFLIGSDFGGMAYIYPGYSFHEEMHLLSQLGISNYDILKMATYNPAVYFEITDRYGSIAEGKAADLVILDRNPVENIRHTLEISSVIRNGKLLDSIKQN